MTDQNANSQPSPVVIERSYEASAEELWDLWTTKEGFESWWGPVGFRVTVHELDLRVGGRLFYDMTAVGAEQVAHMQQSGMTLSHETRGTFTEIEPLRRLKIMHMIDFIPDMKPYQHTMQMELFPDGASTRMVVTIDPHSTPEWTERARQGFMLQLTKVPEALAARRG